MKLLIIGSTGQVGQALTPMALDAGHTVSVLVRSPSKLAPSIASRVEVHAMSSLTDVPALDRALRGQDVVLCVIGPRLFLHPPNTPIANGLEVLTERMAEAGSVKRFIVQSTISDVEARDRFSLLGWLLPELVWAFSHPAWREVVEMGKVVRRSHGFEWIVVRVALLTSLIDGSKVGQGYVGEGGERYVVSRRDVARFMLDNLTEPRWVGEMPLIWSASSLI